MDIKVFGKPGCEFCKTTMKKFETFTRRWDASDYSLVFMDMETVDGLAEGAFYSVTKIPTTIIERDKAVVARWDGKVPLSEEFRSLFDDAVAPEKSEIN